MDMEFENMAVDQDSDQEEEYVEDLTEPQQPTICCRCGQSFPTNAQMFDYEDCPHLTCVGCRFKDTVCILCKPSERLANLSSMETSTGSLKELHSMYFKRKMIKKDHIVDVELSTEEGSVQKQMCTVCKRVFKKSNARYHYLCATGEKPYKCVECGQGFVKKSHLESHLNNHYGFRPFKCTEPKCKASFTQKDKLIRHLKSHTKETKLMCPLCDKLYTSQDILNHHMIKVHSSAKQFKCDQCSRTYKYPSSLRIHQLKHQAKKDYICEICGKRFTLLAQLKLHKSQIHAVSSKSSKRPFKCRHCGRRFMSQRDRTRHVLTHTSCHDFECSICNTTFGRKDNLERHMKNFHQDGPPIMVKKRTLIATVAPFNIKPPITKKEKGQAQSVVKEKDIRDKKQRVLRNDKPKTKPKRNFKKIINVGNCNISKTNISKEKSNQNILKMPLKTTFSQISNTYDNESSKKQSVIVSPKSNVPQNRPSVIKSIPPLLPYRILPPDKRFLKLSEDIGKKMDRSETQTTSSMKTNYSYPTVPKISTSINQVHSLPVHESNEQAVNITHVVVEQPLSTQNVRRRTPKDDALSRCFRIIHHTSAVRSNKVYGTDVSAESSNTSKNHFGPSLRPSDAKINSSRVSQTRFSSTSVSAVPVFVNNKLNDEIRPNSSNKNILGPVKSPYNRTNSNIGGPSLPGNLTENVLELNQEDNFTSSYASMGEATYTSPTYTPYFDSDYIRDSINSYDSNVENLLSNDLDIGFQYIN